MRRFIVICLILLFPLQVFADSAEDYSPADMVAGMSSADVAHAASCAPPALPQAIVCSTHADKQQAAHLDFADILVAAHSTVLPKHDNRMKPVRSIALKDEQPDLPGRPPPSLQHIGHATGLAASAHA